MHRGTQRLKRFYAKMKRPARFGREGGRRARSWMIESKECATLRGDSAERRSNDRTAPGSRQKMRQSRRYKAHRCLSTMLRNIKEVQRLQLRQVSCAAKSPGNQFPCDFTGKSLCTSSMSVSGIWLFSTKPWAPHRRHSSLRASPLNWE